MPLTPMGLTRTQASRMRGWRCRRSQSQPLAHGTDPACMTEVKPDGDPNARRNHAWWICKFSPPINSPQSTPKLSSEDRIGLLCDWDLGGLVVKTLDRTRGSWTHAQHWRGGQSDPGAHDSEYLARTPDPNLNAMPKRGQYPQHEIRSAIRPDRSPRRHQGQQVLRAPHEDPFVSLVAWW